MILLFLFIKYWDDFHSELTDIIGGQQIVVEHLDQILNLNKDVVRDCIQPVLHKVLDEYIQLSKKQRKVQTATHIIYDAVQTIISCSTNHDFRTKSLQLLKVSHSQEIKVSLQSLLQNVLQNRFLPSRVCNRKQVLSGDDVQAECSNNSAALKTSHENLCETDNFQRIYSELESSVSDSSLISLDGDIPCHSNEYMTPETTISFDQRTRKRQLETNTTDLCVNQCSRPSKQTMNGACPPAKDRTC
ncbi:DUF4554 domain-containing protein [Leucoraja erinacea]|uniref:DUF4554 domain-containing protein n=1 Tax=Leucoraja erinaceus TaxID=7782 RepID=UPI0024545E4D|nr:DUF4554 domain-containing protein [Leucoraja erinacea]